MVITIEIKDMNKKTTALKSSVTRGICLEMHCVSDLERCGQRWNLRLHCLPEAEKEKVCVEVISICQEVLPSERDKIPNAIDVANRVGEPTARWPKAPPFHSQVHPRRDRDGIWKAAPEKGPRNGHLYNSALLISKTCTCSLSTFYRLHFTIQQYIKCSFLLLR